MAPTDRSTAPTEATAPRPARLIAVFRDHENARRAGDALDDATVGSSTDHLTEINAEMTEEATRAVGGVGFGALMDREIAHGVIPPTVVGAIAGAVLLSPLALVQWPGVPTIVRILGTLVIGAIAGSTAGFFIGGILASRSVDRPLAAERGITVSTEDGERARQVLLDHDPIRIDVIAADGHVETLATEQDLHPETFVRRMGRQVKGSDRQDEY